MLMALMRKRAENIKESIVLGIINKSHYSVN